MSYTGQITVNSVGYTAIVAQSNCRNIRVMENPGVVGWPTSDFLISRTLPGTTPVRLPGGNAYTFNATGVSGYRGGDTIGYLRTVSGSTTFDQDEDQP